jgi:RNA polymerase sigma-70 factor (ECF subfamily)
MCGMGTRGAKVTDWDEKACIDRAKRDPSAFGELYEAYVDRIYNYIYHRVGNVHEAEDLTSRTFFRALAALPNYQEKGLPFSAWLYRIAHNLVANYHRDHRRRPTVALDEVFVKSAPELHPETVALALDDAQHLNEIVAGLDAVRQELLVLKLSEGLSNVDIARILGRSEGAIKSLYHRTLLQIRKELQKKGLRSEV